MKCVMCVPTMIPDSIKKKKEFWDVKLSILLITKKQRSWESMGILLILTKQ